MNDAKKSKPAELRGQRDRHHHGCWDHLIAAPLWVSYEANVGTLARTCDAVGACLALPRTAHAREALARGNTLGHLPHMHWVGRTPAAEPKRRWLEQRHAEGWRLVAVELADGATRLADVEMTRQRTIVLLGHEHDGVPEEVWSLLDEVIEIPMVGVGSSLNVGVAGSLVLYKLAGLS